MPEVIRFEEVTLFRKESTIINNVTFSIQEGQSVAVLGRNGAGKTTLINILFGYLWPSTGKVFVFGEEYGTTPLAPLQSRMGFLQSSHQDLLLQKSLTALEVIITGIHKTLGLYRAVTPSDQSIALLQLRSLNLEQKADQRYSTLSSGEKTQILLLRAVASGIGLLVLDEPTAALDFTARYNFERSIRKLKLENPTLTRILITHRIEEIPEDFESVMLLKQGKIISFGNKSQVLTNENLSSLYDLPLEVQKINQRFFLSGLSGI
jgi:iron complex transport system ATP-binding protein